MGQGLSGKGRNNALPWFLIIIFLSSFASSEKDNKIEWLKRNVKKINTTEPYLNDFSDLEFLKRVLDSSSIVILGEMHHTDGTTKLAKSRIVRFLHEQMGFNVLVNEGDIYSYRKVNELLSLNMTEKNILKLMDEAETNDQVLNIPMSSTYDLDLYIGHSISSQNPLKLAGIDIFSNNLRYKYMARDLNKYILSIDSSENSKQLVNDYLTDAKKMEDIPHFSDIKNRNSFAKLTNRLIGLVSTNPMKTKEGFFWIQLLKTNLVCAEVYGSMTRPFEKEGLFKLFAPRDKIMAENIEWIMDHEYKGEKIIVWISSYHATRNISKIKGLKSNPMDTVTMGNYLYKKYGNKMYSMVFVPYSGFTGSNGYSKPTMIPKHSPESLESLIHLSGFTYGYLDLRTIPLGGEWLKDENKMYPTFWNETRARWPDIYDGIFYIDQMIPDKHCWLLER